MDDEATNQVVDDGATLVDTEAATGVEAGDEQQFDDEGNVIEAPAEDEEELDIHGHKVKLPKSAAEKLAAERLMQADYTRKTQELADTRKAFEAERSQLQQADAEVLTARANLNIIDRQIAEFGKVNFSAWMQQATAAYDEDEKARCQAAFMQYQNLKDAKAQTQNYLSAYQQDQTLKQQQETAKLREQAAAEISREIPDWSPAKAAAMREATTKSYGYSDDDIGSLLDTDARAVRLVRDALAWRDHQTKTKKAQAIQKQQEVQPAATASSRGNPVPPGKLDDRLSAEEWTRRRNAQIAKQGR
jgi:hypothetical protein